MKTWMAACLLFSVGCFGADAPPRPVPYQTVNVEKRARHFDWKFAAVLGISTAANLADMARTDDCLRNIAYCRETNPLYGPHPSSARLYGSSLALEAGFAVTSYELRRHGPAPLRKLWWVPLTYEGLDHVKGIALSRR